MQRFIAVFAKPLAGVGGLVGNCGNQHLSRAISNTLHGCDALLKPVLGWFAYSDFFFIFESPLTS